MFSLGDYRLYPLSVTLLALLVMTGALFAQRTTSLLKVGYLACIALGLAQFSDMVVAYSENGSVAAQWEGLLCVGYCFYIPLYLHTMMHLVGLKRSVTYIFPFYAFALANAAVFPFSLHPSDYYTTAMGCVNPHTANAIQVATITFMIVGGIAIVVILARYNGIFRRTNPAKHAQIRLVTIPTFSITVLAFVTQWLLPIMGHDPIPVFILISGCVYPLFIALLVRTTNLGKELFIDEIRRFMTGTVRTLEIAAGPDFMILHLSTYAKGMLDTVSGQVVINSSLAKVFPISTGEFQGLQAELEKAVAYERKIINAFDSRIMVRQGRKMEVLVSAYLQYEEEGKTLKWFVLNLVEKPKARAEIQARDLERERIGQDLHDGILNPLKSIKDQLGNISAKTELQYAVSQSKIAERKIQVICDEVRAISTDLTPVILSKFGLLPALEQMKYDFAASGIKVTIEAQGLKTRFDEFSETQIFRIIQELCNNVKKHAKAKAINLRLLIENELFTITVEDDGRGFDTTKLYSSKGSGWQNVRSRVNLLSGQVDIDSRPDGNGTMVWVELPFKV